MKYLNFMDNLSKAGKVLLSIFVFDITWGIYRIIKGANNRSAIQVLLGILWTIFGSVILWILDLICLITNDYPFWFK